MMFAIGVDGDRDESGVGDVVGSDADVSTGTALSFQGCLL